MIMVDEVFNIVEEKDKTGCVIYRVRFKHDNSMLKPNGMGLHRYTAEVQARRWLNNPKNKKAANPFVNLVVNNIDNHIPLV